MRNTTKVMEKYYLIKKINSYSKVSSTSRRKKQSRDICIKYATSKTCNKRLSNSTKKIYERTNKIKYSKSSTAHSILEAHIWLQRSPNYSNSKRKFTQWTKEKNQKSH